MSSGEFVGLVADNPDEKIDLKAFHNSIINDHAALKAEADNYKPIPAVRKVDNDTLTANYFSIKADIEELIQKEIPVKAQ